MLKGMGGLQCVLSWGGSYLTHLISANGVYLDLVALSQLIHYV